MERHKFVGWDPHPTEPLSLETFAMFDQTIAQINSSVGVNPHSSYYAESNADPSRPGVRVSQLGSRSIAHSFFVGVTALDGLVYSYNARNDCGVADESLTVARLTVVHQNRPYLVLNEAIVSDTDMRALHEVVAGRDDYVKKRHVVLLPSMLVSSRARRR